MEKTSVEIFKLLALCYSTNLIANRSFSGLKRGAGLALPGYGDYDTTRAPRRGPAAADYLWLSTDDPGTGRDRIP